MEASRHSPVYAAGRLARRGRRGGKVMRIWQGVARVCAVAAELLRAVILFLLRSAAARLRGKRYGLNGLGECLSSAFERLGGGFVKIGQILSTRTDLLPEELTTPLRRLQNAQAPFPAAEALSIVGRSLGASPESLFQSFDPAPVGSASIAQVHRAVLRDTGAEVAVKVRRPGIDRIVAIDARAMVALTRAVSWLPAFRQIPLVEAVEQVARTVEAQASFFLEAARHRRFFTLFAGGTPVRVPRLLDKYCSDEVLVMEYFPGLVRINAPELDEATHRSAVTAGLRGLYKMLFLEGLVHCDLHPGNILVGRDGGVVIVDFGFSTLMRPAERAAFAKLFLSIALGDGDGAARIVLETAQHAPDDLDREGFEREISELITRSRGQRASDFLIVSFVNSLFRIQRKYGIRSSSSFTLAILSLTVYEGIIRQRYADLDFQREAVPTLLLSLRKAG